MITAVRRRSASVEHREDDLLRLDLLENPYAPTPSARSLAAREDDWVFSAGLQMDMLMTRLSSVHQVPPESIIVVRNVDDQYGNKPASRNGPFFTDRDDVAVIASPDRVTGRFLSVQRAVRLARSHRMVIIDERLSGYFHRDHLPLFREFENVVLLRSLDSWLRPLGHSLSYGIVKPAHRAELCGWRDDVDPLTLGLAVATFDDHRYMAAANRQVTRERVGLIRSLRKLNMVRPLPSAANFVSATVERGDRESLRSYLERERIWLHYPEAAEHRQLIRISAVSARATATLASALIAWARDI